MKQLFKKVLGRLQQKLEPKGHANTGPFFECLQKIGFRPKHIIDIGAHRGGWTRTALSYFPESHFSLFEPQRDLLEQQSDLVINPRIRLYYVGVGPETETRKMTASPRRDSYSFQWSEDQSQKLGRSQFEMEVVALDQFLSDQTDKFPPPDVVKIDAEGWDLEVLKGATKTVAGAEIVLLEAGVMNKSFKNTARQVINEMYDQNFVLFDITDLNRTTRNKGLWNVELAFVSNGGQLEKAIDKYS